MNSSTPIDAPTIAAAEMDARLAITGHVGNLLEELMDDGATSQSEIASKLGVSRSWVSATLNGPGNWTLGTVGKLLASVGYKIGSIHLVPIGSALMRNCYHEWLDDVPQITVSISPIYRGQDSNVTLNILPIKVIK